MLPWLFSMLFTLAEVGFCSQARELGGGAQEINTSGRGGGAQEINTSEKVPLILVLEKR